MRAIVLTALGDPDNLRLEKRPDLVPAAGEAVVRLRAAALNRRDVWIRKGQYAGIKLPIILGSDGAGEVIEVGERVDRAWLGRQVVIDPSLNWGGDERAQDSAFNILGLPVDGTYAEMVKVPAANLHAKPAHLSWEEAAAVPLASVTAYRALVTRAQVLRGETVLITGIGGGVALAALQICKSLGAEVWVTSRSETKLERARALGADHVLDTRSGDVASSIRSATSKAGVDVVIDNVGRVTWPDSIRALGKRGRLVTCGGTSGPIVETDVRRMFWSQLTLMGSTMGNDEEFDAITAELRAGRLLPPIDSVHSLEDGRRAYARLTDAEQFGKVVISVS